MQRELCATVGKNEYSVTARRDDGGHWRVVIDDREHTADACEVRPGMWSLLVEGVSWIVDIDDRKGGTVVLLGATETEIRLEDARRKRLASLAHRGNPASVGPEVVTAAIAGKVVKVLVEVGAQVEVGESLMVLEAMKMENEINAPRAGVIAAVHVVAEQSVDTQEPLITLHAQC